MLSRRGPGILIVERDPGPQPNDASRPHGRMLVIPMLTIKVLIPELRPIVLKTNHSWGKTTKVNFESVPGLCYGAAAAGA